MLPPAVCEEVSILDRTPKVYAPKGLARTRLGEHGQKVRPALQDLGEPSLVIAAQPLADLDPFALPLTVGAVRSSGALSLNAAAAMVAVHQTLVEEEPAASVDTSSIRGVEITIVTSEQVTLPFSVFEGTATLHARATARLVAGYDRPS